MKEEQKATWLGMIGNLILFIGKLVVGIAYNSIAIISDALNSFTDIISSFIVHLSVIISYDEPDKEHQFGHDRAQPIAALIVAIFIGIVGFEIIAASISRIMEGQQLRLGLFPVILIAIVMLVKFLMFLYTRAIYKKTKSIALKASTLDHRNDAIVSFAVLIGIVVSNLGYPIFDPVVGIIIGVWIIISGYNIGMDNIKFLMGESPPKEFFDKIEGYAKSIKGVIGLNDVRAHYVGTTLDVELHIYVNKNMNVQKAHDIGKKVQNKVESMEDISRAFVHIDPFLGKFIRKRRF